MYQIIQLLPVGLIPQIDIEVFDNRCDKHAIGENWIFADWTCFHMLENYVTNINLSFCENAVNQKSLQERYIISVPSFRDENVRYHVM